MNNTNLSTDDRLEIQDLFSLYGYLVDDNRADEWAALFTEDGVFDVPGLMRMEGHEQVRKVVEMVAKGSQGKWRHQLTNVLAQRGEQADTATVRMNGLVTDWSADPATMTFNDYTAKLRKIAGQWRIEEIVARPNKVTV